MLIIRRADPNSYYGQLTRLKKLFWLYLVLLLFEGALRKWVAPQLTAPLLVIRDPVSVMIIWEGYRTGKWLGRWSTIVALLTVLMVGLFAIQTTAGGNPILVGLFGLRSYLLMFPVVFIMGEHLDEQDLRKMGIFILRVLPPMALLEAAQYRGSTDSFLNKGAYAGGAQIGYVADHVRASGTFSFVVGAVDFGVLAAAFILYGMIREGFASKRLLWIGVFSLILSIPMTGARAYVFLVGAMVGCMALGAATGVSQFAKVLRVIVPVGLALLLVSYVPVFDRAMGSLDERFTSGAGGSQESEFFARVAAPVIVAFESPDFSNPMGDGMGRGAIAMQSLLNNSQDAVEGEGSIGRETSELGWIAGSAYEIFKLFMGIMLFSISLTRARSGDALALLLCSFAICMLWFSSPEQVTEQGFTVISMAFCIAAARVGAQPQTLQYPRALRSQPVLVQRWVQRAGTASQDRLRRP